jgi:hypothetical protein
MALSNWKLMWFVIEDCSSASYKHRLIATKNLCTVAMEANCEMSLLSWRNERVIDNP